MLGVMIAGMMFGGTGCGAVYAPAAQVYTTQAYAPTYSYQTYTPSYSYQAYTPSYQIAYRNSYVGYAAQDEEKARQLIIIDNLTKSQTKIIDKLSDRIDALELERASLLQNSSASGPARGTGELSGSSVLQRRCAQCHTGAKAAENRWLMPKDLENPSIKTRLRIYNAVTRAENPMPMGGKLSDAEMQALKIYTSFTNEELEEDDAPPAPHPAAQPKTPQPPAAPKKTSGSRPKPSKAFLASINKK